MIDHTEIETRAIQIYEGWNWATGIPWGRRNETLKNRYREIARDQLVEALALETTEKGAAA